MGFEPILTAFSGLPLFRLGYESNMEVGVRVERTISCFADNPLIRLGFRPWCGRLDSSQQNRGFKPQMSSCCITPANLFVARGLPILHLWMVREPFGFPLLGIAPDLGLCLSVSICLSFFPPRRSPLIGLNYWWGCLADPTSPPSKIRCNHYSSQPSEIIVLPPGSVCQAASSSFLSDHHFRRPSDMLVFSSTV